MDKFEIKRALISVSDKKGVTDLVKVLVSAGVEIISTGGTARLLRDNDYNVIDAADYTGSPEVFGGRVKTLHPRICGGILMRRGNPADEKEALAHHIEGIDLVVVNLYPFAERVSGGISEESALEEIDIGGVTLLRAAAKSFHHVATLHTPEQYEEFISEFRNPEGINLETRRRWAVAAFGHTFRYDAAIYEYLSGSENLTIVATRKKTLRYGENPHQKASWFTVDNSGISGAVQLWGKELSYLNALDLNAAYEISRDFDRCACVIIKHTTPSGLAVGDNPLEAYRRAFSCDTRSPFGGIVGFNREVDADTAKELSSIFLEAIIAPSYIDEALSVLKKKKNLRLMKWGDAPIRTGEKRIISISGGFLAQTADDAPITRDSFKVVTRKQPTEELWEVLVFGTRAVKWVKSNAVVFCDRRQTLGIGGGQTSRVGAVEIAVANARRFGLSLDGSVMASDAFFPFPDSVEEAAKEGTVAIVQPGGSIRDKEVIEAADRLGIAMVFTGKRHFRH